jgi:ABC-type multidrug transport system fused ATPase/permease subunit
MVKREQLCKLDLQRGNVGRLELHTDRRPVLMSSANQQCLEFVEGCGLSDLAPGLPVDSSLGSKVQAEYLIVGVNSARGAEAMAKELSDPPATLLLDLWSVAHAGGMRVTMEKVCAGYCNDKSVLHDVSVDIAPCSKVGFVGKTGCGKSTSLLCLLRILEPRGGKITLGGMDAQRLGLKTLRSIVGLVPQDPTVFQGTVRYNVDPFDQFPDSCVTAALEAVQYLQFLGEDGLKTEVARDGANLSVGQRQLLSLARMVIKQPPILLLDECTSALDPGTQEVVQKALTSSFPMTTVIAVAHRLETVMDFDQIVSFESGSVVESGSVQDLLKRKDGVFAKMVQASKKGAGEHAGG